MKPSEHGGLLFEDRDIEALRKTLRQGRHQKINGIKAEAVLDSLPPRKIVAALVNANGYYHYPVDEMTAEAVRHTAEHVSHRTYLNLSARRAARYLINEWPAEVNPVLPEQRYQAAS